jgi:GIY-YIG catalytic domain-containing protein
VTLPVVVQVERVWYIYRFWDADGRLLYIGQTGRNAMTRWAEHIEHQWWADEIVTSQRQALTYSSLADVRRAEEKAIKSEFPLHNIEHNQGNPNRIIAPPHGVVVQRRGGRPSARPIVPQRRRRLWTAGRIWAASIVGIWLGADGAISWACDSIKGGTVLTLILLASAFFVRPRRRRRRRRW